MEYVTLIARICQLALLIDSQFRTWHKMGQTKGSVFGGIARSMEECRAECTVLWLAVERPLLEIFGCRETGVDEGFEESESNSNDTG